jgi:uracil-DNA glycosylase
MFFEQMHPIWQNWLQASKPMLEAIQNRVLASGDILPAKSQVMRAFELDPTNIKVVLLGQDPYPTPGDAVGLAFAVSAQTKLPRSLKNIITELASDGFVSVGSDLTVWSEKGVLLLNTALTTKPGEAGAHSLLGWDQFTLQALKVLAEQKDFVVLAWGNHAKKVGEKLPANVLIIESAHPSPLSASRGFFGSKPFSRANQALKTLGQEPIDWSL